MKLWLEFDSFLPGTRNLQGIGEMGAGFGHQGMYIADSVPLSDTKACRDYISGPADAAGRRAFAADAHERLRRCADGSRGVDWSGHMLKRQALAALRDESAKPGDEAMQIGYIRQVMTDAVGGLELDFGYVNHEAARKADGRMLDVETTARLIASLVGERFGATVVSWVTCGVWKHRCWWCTRPEHVMPLCPPDLFTPWGLRPVIEAWITRQHPFAQRLSPAWNGLIDVVNQGVSLRRALVEAGKESSVLPAAHVRGITQTHNPAPATATTAHEQAVYRAQARVLAALGVEHVVVFNCGGRGDGSRGLLSPGVDFAAMHGEDLWTHQAFEQAASQVARQDAAALPRAPVPFDSPEIRLGDLVLKYDEVRG
jgi:hypothetical protein